MHRVMIRSTLTEARGCRCDGHGEATLLPCLYLLMAKGDLCSHVMVSVGAVELVVSGTLGSLNNVLRSLRCMGTVDYNSCSHVTLVLT